MAACAALARQSASHLASERCLACELGAATHGRYVQPLRERRLQWRCLRRGVRVHHARCTCRVYAGQPNRDRDRHRQSDERALVPIAPFANAYGIYRGALVVRGRLPMIALFRAVVALISLTIAPLGWAALGTS